MPYLSSAWLLALPYLGTEPPISAAPQPVRWSLQTGLLVSRLRYAQAHQRLESNAGGTEYALGRHPAQAGLLLGGSLAIPVPPDGITTFLVLTTQLAYNRRILALHATPYGPAPAPAYDARLRYRTLDVQVGLGVRHLLAPRRQLFWEAGPVLVLTCQDYSRLDAGTPNRYAEAPGSNVLLRLALGAQLPAPFSRYQLALGYARGLLTRRTQVSTSEDCAELTLRYRLDQ